MIRWIRPDEPFPPHAQALREPNGLLCAGADLSVGRLKLAYSQAIFPWFNDGEPVLWWSPDPRLVLDPSAFHASRRLKRQARALPWQFSVGASFARVLAGCAAPRVGEPSTWLIEPMQRAYLALHLAGDAQSVEIWLPRSALDRAGTSAINDDGAEWLLVGGTYGATHGPVFFAESMFSAVADASKLALWALCTLALRDGFRLIDAQVETPHLRTLGATLMPRARLIETLRHSPAPAPRLAARERTPLSLLLH
jgi:leucyl/phenylalanyl-tRNA---protein transferase